MDRDEGVVDMAEGVVTTGPEAVTRLLDADDFLDFTRRLHALRATLGEARVTAEQRGRWHRRLATVADLGTRDLDRAAGQLVRFEDDLRRALGR